jgi:rhodanese-related sulfurtransferase
MTLVDARKAVTYFENKLEFTTGPAELNGMIERNENIRIIDVRGPEDFGKGHIPGAINLPKDSWETLSGLDKDRVNIVYCYSEVCHLSAEAAKRFAEAGFSVMELEGGFDGWKAYNLPIVT